MQTTIETNDKIYTALLLPFFPSLPPNHLLLCLKQIRVRPKSVVQDMVWIIRPHGANPAGEVELFITLVNVSLSVTQGGPTFRSMSLGQRH